MDLGSNNLTNLYEFRNLRLDHLEVLSLASNQVTKSPIQLNIFIEMVIF